MEEVGTVDGWGHWGADEDGGIAGGQLLPCCVRSGYDLSHCVCESSQLRDRWLVMGIIEKRQ